ncbi:MAG TPA: hypothetical protein VLM40_01630, partial [Gemmata sp.]|nr:hypothetical protein [Gemmata sp.]
GKFEDAVRELESAARSPYAPGSVVAQFINMKARWLRATGNSQEDWRRMEQLLNESRGRFGPASSEPVILLAEIGIAVGKVQEVVQLLRKETANRPGDARLWAVLASAVAKLRGTASGLAVVDEAQAIAGDSPDVRLARARLYTSEPGRVRPLGPLMEHIEAWPEIEQLRLLTGMVEVFDHVGDQAGVVGALRGLASRRPSDANVLVRIHERSLRMGDAEAAGAARAALVKLESESGQSVLLCDAAAASPADAASLIARFSAAFGPEPRRADTCLALSRLTSLIGDEVQAAKFKERAFNLEPTRYDAAQAWLLHLCSEGDDTRTQRLVIRLGTDPRWSGDPFHRLVASVIPRVQPETAGKLLRWTRPLVEREPGALRWLAEAAATCDNPEINPLNYLLEATNREDATADDWLALALARMPADLKAARAKVSPTAFFGAVAVLLETSAGKDFDPQLENPGDKQLLMQARLSVKLSRNRPQEAARVLEKHLAEKDLSKGDLAWCRRNLAMLYAVGGTPADRRRAMELITSVDDVGTSPEELRSTASVLTTLSRYLEGGDRVKVLTRAATALATAYEKGKAPQDLYNLSQLYRAAGNRIESRKCLQTLLKLEIDPNGKKAKNIYYLTE